MPSGAYFFKFKTGDFVETHKMPLIYEKLNIRRRISFMVFLSEIHWWVWARKFIYCKFKLAQFIP